MTGYGLILKVYGYVADDELYLNRFDIIPSKVDFQKTSGIFSKWNKDETDDLVYLKNGSIATDLNELFDSFK